MFVPVGGSNPSYRHYGVSSVIKYIRNVQCSGSENRLVDCPHSFALNSNWQCDETAVQCDGMFI